MIVYAEMQLWAIKEHCKLWQSTAGCREVMMFLCGPNKQLSCFTLCLNCRQQGILVRWLTSHIALSRHLTVVKIHTYSQCPACRYEEEILHHFLGNYIWLTWPQCWAANLTVDVTAQAAHPAGKGKVFLNNYRYL